MSATLARRHAQDRLHRAVLEERAESDPLLTYQHASWASEWVARHIHEAWIYWHAANSGGKSRSLGALWVAFLQGKRELGGIPIPVIKPPVHGGLGTPTYKLGAAGSIIDIVRELIGKWPHHEDRVQGGNVSVFYVQHQDHRVDNHHEWSKLFVFPYEGPIPEGARWDFWGCDEPPPPLWLSAALNRGKRGRRLYGAIGATPIHRSKWGPIREQFPKQHLQIIEGRARVESSVYDNRFLTPEDIKRQEQANPPSDPLSEAKLWGKHVDASGSCPFVLTNEEWARLLAECSDPIEVADWNISMDTEDGSKIVRTVPVKIWKHAEPDKLYRFCIDASSGVEDTKHDPWEGEMVEVGTGEQVLTCGGRMAGTLVGILGAGLCRQYNDAKADPETNDRWGVNVFEGFRRAGYGNFAQEKRQLNPSEWVDEPGFHNTRLTRPLMIGAVQEWLAAWQAGIPYAKHHDKSYIECLMDCILDEKGKIVGGIGLHDEKLIVMGQNLRRSVMRSHRIAPALHKPLLTPEQISQKIDAAGRKRLAGLIRGTNGDGVHEHSFQRQRILRPKMRPGT